MGNCIRYSYVEDMSTEINLIYPKSYPFTISPIVEMTSTNTPKENHKLSDLTSSSLGDPKNSPDF